MWRERSIQPLVKKIISKKYYTAAEPTELIPTHNGGIFTVNSAAICAWIYHGFEKVNWEASTALTPSASAAAHPQSGWIFSASVLRRLRREPGEGLPLDAAHKSWLRSTQLSISQIRPGRRGVSAAQKEGGICPAWPSILMLWHWKAGGLPCSSSPLSLPLGPLGKRLSPRYPGSEFTKSRSPGTLNFQVPFRSSLLSPFFFETVSVQLGLALNYVAEYDFEFMTTLNSWSSCFLLIIADITGVATTLRLFGVDSDTGSSTCY